MNTYEHPMEPEILDLEKIKTEQEIRFGNSCPQCKTCTLDYDGCLNLICHHCGFFSSGSFT